MKTHSNHKPSSLAEALAQNRSLLVRQATRMLHSGSNAEDAAQDALVLALAHLQDFRGDAKLGTWLYRVGANAVLMNIRHDRRMVDRAHRAAEQASPELDWLHGSSHFVPPQAEAEGEEQSQILHVAVDHLPEHYRQVVILCDFQELPMEQVAEVLGITVGGVRTRRLRAHRMLKTALLHHHTREFYAKGR